MQCCTCSNWVHSKCSIRSFSRFRTLGSSHSWSCPPCCYQHCDFLLGFFQLIYLHCSIWPLLLMLHSHPTLAFKPLILFRPLSVFSLCTLTTGLCSWLFLFTSCFFFPSLTLSVFVNGMLGVSEPGALKCYTSFRLISLTLFVSRNLTLIYLPLSESLDPLLCDPMAATPDLVFFLLMSQTLAAASSFSSGRAYPSLSFLPPLFLRLTPTLIM